MSSIRHCKSVKVVVGAIFGLLMFDCTASAAPISVAPAGFSPITFTPGFANSYVFSPNDSQFKTFRIATSNSVADGVEISGNFGQAFPVIASTQASYFDAPAAAIAFIDPNLITGNLASGVTYETSAAITSNNFGSGSARYGQISIGDGSFGTFYFAGSFSGSSFLFSDYGELSGLGSTEPGASVPEVSSFAIIVASLMSLAFCALLRDQVSWKP